VSSEVLGNYFSIIKLHAGRQIQLLAIHFKFSDICNPLLVGAFCIKIAFQEIIANSSLFSFI